MLAITTKSDKQQHADEPHQKAPTHLKTQCPVYSSLGGSLPVEGSAEEARREQLVFSYREEHTVPWR